MPDLHLARQGEKGLDLGLGLDPSAKPEHRGAGQRERQLRAHVAHGALGQVVRLVHHDDPSRKTLLEEAARAHAGVKDVVLVAHHHVRVGRQIHRERVLSG